MSGLTLSNLFGNINDPSVQKVMRALDMVQDVEIASGQYVFKEGDKSTDFYIIGLGALEVVKVIDPVKGSEKVLDTLGSGDFFGEGAVFTDTPRSASVRALSECRLFKIDKQRFFELLKNNNEIAVTFLSNMLSVVNSRLHHANRELVVLYEVSRLIAEQSQGMSHMADGILNQLSLISEHKKSMFVIHNELNSSFKTIAALGFDADVPSLDSLLPDLKEIERELETSKVHYKIIGAHLLLPIKSPRGKLIGYILLLENDNEYKDDDLRLCVSVAEQLSHVIEINLIREDSSQKEKMNREFLSF